MGNRGLWIWRLSDIRTDYISKLKKCNVKRVYLKVLDAASDNVFWDFQCTKAIIKKFHENDIEVYGWGFHYGYSDFSDEVEAIDYALDCGILGYVADMESAVENSLTHTHVRKFLKSIRDKFDGNLGYTSFGHPEFHPKVPWKILDKYCDFAMPQIYYEKFTFKNNNAEEVTACLKAHETMGLNKPIYPIWGSESDSHNPSPADELQFYLQSHPGSSIWRAPKRGERGEAWNLDYSDPTIEIVPEVIPGADNVNLLVGAGLPTLKRYLRLGSIGDDVEALQKALFVRAIYTGSISGEFHVETQSAVRLFQAQSAISIDGVVGPETWGALGGATSIEVPESNDRGLLADIAQREGELRLKWTGADSEAEKYLEPLRKPMQDIDHIGNDPVFFNWCAAFVTWCCREAGISIPNQPDGFYATMALVEAWKYWAKKENFWFDPGSTNPIRGDIVVFEWFDGDSQLDHIGVVSSYEINSEIFISSEGNKGNRTYHGKRKIVNVAGIIRII